MIGMILLMVIIGVAVIAAIGIAVIIMIIGIVFVSKYFTRHTAGTQEE